MESLFCCSCHRFLRINHFLSILYLTLFQTTLHTIWKLPKNVSFYREKRDTLFSKYFCSYNFAGCENETFWIIFKHCASVFPVSQRSSWTIQIRIVKRLSILTPSTLNFQFSTNEIFKLGARRGARKKVSESFLNVPHYEKVSKSRCHYPQANGVQMSGFVVLGFAAYFQIESRVILLGWHNDVWRLS